MDNFKNFQNKKARLKEAKRHQVLEQKQIKKTKQDQGITLVALVVTTIFSYDEKLKFSNSKGFLLKAI